jgi:hypothetical protein
MRQLRTLNPGPRIGRPACVGALALAALACAPARSADILGLYAGAAFGQAQVATGAPDISTARFKENHSAYKLMVGVRPTSLIGAEVAYLNFGNPSGSLGGLAASAKIDGAAAFGVLYLPIPVPFLDVYAKAGMARLNATLQGTAPVVGAFKVDATDTRVAAGVGVQLKFGSLAVRGEYERFDVPGGNPGLLTVGLTKTFL